MMTSIEATIERDGQVRLKEPVHLAHPCRAIVTIVGEPAIAETALVSEPALAEDWNRPEEDAAWSHLQPKAQFSFGFPLRFFTANTALMAHEAGLLKPEKHRQIIAAVVALLEGRAPQSHRKAMQLPPTASPRTAVPASPAYVVREDSVPRHVEARGDWVGVAYTSGEHSVVHAL